MILRSSQGALYRSLDPEYAAWHLVGGSYPDSGLGQSRLLKGQNDILQPGRCQIPHSQRPEGPKDFQGSRVAGLRGHTPRAARAEMPDAVARWRSALTQAALRQLWRGPGRGRRT